MNFLIYNKKKYYNSRRSIVKNATPSIIGLKQPSI